MGRQLIISEGHKTTMQVLLGEETVVRSLVCMLLRGYWHGVEEAMAACKGDRGSEIRARHHREGRLRLLQLLLALLALSNQRLCGLNMLDLVCGPTIHLRQLDAKQGLRLRIL